MAKVSKEVSRTLGEYLIGTGWVTTPADKVDITVKIEPHITLQYPIMSARMQSVTGPLFAKVGGRLGVFTSVPGSLPDSDKLAIVNANTQARLKKGDVEFLENPESVQPNTPLEDVVKLAERTGYSIFPVMDRRSEIEGFYIHNPSRKRLAPDYTHIDELMIPLNKKEGDGGIPFLLTNPGKEVHPEQVKNILERDDAKYKFLPILEKGANEKLILKQIAFVQKFDTNFIGMTIPSRGNWEEEMEKWSSDTHAFILDSSNICFNAALDIVKFAKKRYSDHSMIVGNIIYGEAYKKFAIAGADLILGGMAEGSICRTGSERGNARGQAIIGEEMYKTQKMLEQRKKPIYSSGGLDGGMDSIHTISVGLSHTKVVMLGGWLNCRYEAAANKFEDEAAKDKTNDESAMRYVETWGEGSEKARIVAKLGMNYQEDMKAITEASEEEVKIAFQRYGETSISGATIEGVAGTCKYKGRLKPALEELGRYLRLTVSNTGASNLKEYRDMAILELASEETLKKMKPHGVSIHI